MIEFHEAANIFPMDEENISRLARDIKEHGLKVPIELLNGLVIDGRRRLKACEIAGVEPVFAEVTTDDPVGHVISLNLERRHLNEIQRGMVAGRATELKDRYAEDAKERQRAAGGDRRSKAARPVVAPGPQPNGKSTRTRDKIGGLFGVGGRTVARATNVLKNGIPELIEAVDAGELALKKAEVIAKMSANEQRKEVEAIKNGRTKPKPKVKDEPPADERNYKSRGKGIAVAHQAINLLAQIPQTDQLRKRGFEIVKEWVERNLRKMR